IFNGEWSTAWALWLETGENAQNSGDQAWEAWILDNLTNLNQWRIDYYNAVVKWKDDTGKKWIEALGGWGTELDQWFLDTLSSFGEWLGDVATSITEFDLAAAGS